MTEITLHVRDAQGIWWDVLERAHVRRGADDLPLVRERWLYFLARGGATRRCRLTSDWTHLDAASLAALLDDADWMHPSPGMWLGSVGAMPSSAPSVGAMSTERTTAS